MITYEWIFPEIECNPQNEIKIIHWKYVGTEGEYSECVYASCTNSEGIDFDAVTKQQLIQCVLNDQLTLTENEMQQNISDKIEKQKTPQSISKFKNF